MTRSRIRLAAPIVAGALAIGALCAAPPEASAQSSTKDKSKELTPPVPNPPKDPPSHLMGMLMVLVLGGLVIGVNFIPSKRGHQD